MELPLGMVNKHAFWYCTSICGTNYGTSLWVHRKFRYISITEKVIPRPILNSIYRHFRYIGVPNIPSE